MTKWWKPVGFWKLDPVPENKTQWAIYIILMLFAFLAGLFVGWRLP